MGNEKLIVPEPAVDVIDMQSVATSPEEAAYTYQRADGTVERALNAQDAIARCPVLGKLAIEAPEQANVLLELATAGKAKMAAEAKEEPRKPKSEEKVEIKAKKADEPTSEKQVVVQAEQIRKTEPALTVAEHVENKPQTIKPIVTTQQQAGLAGQQIQEEKGLHVIKVVAETPRVMESRDTEIGQRIKLTEAAVLSKLEPARLPNVDRREVEVLAVPIDPEVQQREEPKPIASHSISTDTRPIEGIVRPVELSHVDDEITTEIGVGAHGENSRVGVEPYESDDLTEQTIDTPEVEAYIVDDELEYTAEFYDTSEPSEHIPQLAIESEPVVVDISSQVETEKNEQLEQLFEPETLETYQRLAVLTIDEEVSAVTLPNTTPIETNTLIELETRTETVAVTDFETFIAAQLTSEAPLNFGVIQEQANEQPLEQTIIQLVELLSEPWEETERASLWAIMQEIEMALPACYVRQEGTETGPKPQITPEMTEKLLILLRALGYQNPKEELVNFVTKYGLAFLLQALEYMSQLCDDDSRQEFLVASTNTTIANDDSARLRLGKVLFGLIARVGYDPGFQVSA